MLPLSDNFEDSRSAVQLTLAARVGLRKGTLLDEALVEQWFGLSDVELTWGNPETNLAFFASPPVGADQRIIVLEREPVGYIRWQSVRDGEYAGTPFERYFQPAAVRVDVLVGPRDRRMVGLGSVALQRVREELSGSRGALTLFGIATVQHLAARRAFEKAGFLHHVFYDDPRLGPTVAMVCPAVVER